MIHNHYVNPQPLTPCSPCASRSPSTHTSIKHYKPSLSTIYTHHGIMTPSTSPSLSTINPSIHHHFTPHFFIIFHPLTIQAVPHHPRCGTPGPAPTCSPKALHLPPHDALRELGRQGIVVAGGAGLQPIDGQQKAQGNLVMGWDGRWDQGGGAEVRPLEMGP